MALITPRMNPAMPQYIDYAASVALFTWVETLAAPNGSQVLDPYGSDNTSTDVVNLTTPEGFIVLWHQNGSSIDIYIQVSAAKTEKFVKGGMVPSDYSSSNRSVELFLNRDQEVYDGRAALNSDTDFDGINNTRETACGTSPTDNDSDDDGILDGIERGWCEDSPLDADATINALDNDSDGDGILDGVEDANKNGIVDIGETDGLDADSDDDGIADGDEDHNRNGFRDTSGGVFNESSPLDRDSDDDGVLDGTEDTNHNGLYASGDDLSSLTLVDTDGDGLWDGQELGVSAPGADTDMTKFRRDLDPFNNTLPKDGDTDDDGILDGTEDLDRNGRVDSGEANPSRWDTDGDGLCDGNCSGKGEDFNLNGTRDQDASGNWTETDFLANDSDVDGIHDGAEVNGSWCFKGEIATCGSTNTTRALLPLNPDTDGDGLRDGQETSGWMVGVWFERTMSKHINYSVTSDPWAGRADSDADGLSDFEEFMNGSDPRALDTDGDRITDPEEIARHSNITGIEGTPPVISNVTWRVDKWIETGWNYLAIHVTVKVVFDIDDAVGLREITVRFNRSQAAPQSVPQIPNGAVHMHASAVFEFSLAEAILSGGDINITASDVNGNGAWGQFHLKSVVENVAETVVALFHLDAIAKVIVEAVSALAQVVFEIVKRIMGMATDFVFWCIGGEAITNGILAALSRYNRGDGDLEAVVLVALGPLGQSIRFLMDALNATMNVVQEIVRAAEGLLNPFITLLKSLLGAVFGSTEFQLESQLPVWVPSQSSAEFPPRTLDHLAFLLYAIDGVMGLFSVKTRGPIHDDIENWTKKMRPVQVAFSGATSALALLAFVMNFKMILEKAPGTEVAEKAVTGAYTKVAKLMWSMFTTFLAGLLADLMKNATQKANASGTNASDVVVLKIFTLVLRVISVYAAFKALESFPGAASAMKALGYPVGLIGIVISGLSVAIALAYSIATLAEFLTGELNL